MMKYLYLLIVSTCLYSIRGIQRLLVWVYYRKIAVHQAHLVPRSGPAIIAAAPHTNSLAETMVLMQTIPREINLVMRLPALRNSLLMSIMVPFKKIVVNVPNESIKKGVGHVRLDPAMQDKRRIIGINTEFTRQFSPATTMLAIDCSPNIFTGLVERIDSDTLLYLKHPLDPPANQKMSDKGGCTYSIYPSLNREKLYNAVGEALHNRECVVIYPEGTSHEHSQTLPFKVGTAIMVLSSMAKYPDLDVPIIPCGLNYVDPARFRSNVTIKYGPPIKIDQSLVEQFKQGGRERHAACRQLTEEIQRAIHKLTINASDHDTLKMIQTARRLYQPETPLKSHQLLEITRQMLKGYSMTKDEPWAVQLYGAIKAYNQLLSSMHFQDRQVKFYMKDVGVRAIKRLAYGLAMSIGYGLLAMPGMLLNLPAILLVRWTSKREIARCKAIFYNLTGRPKVATCQQFFGLVILPINHLLQSLILGYMLVRCGWSMMSIGLLIICMAFIILPSIFLMTIFLIEHGLETFRSIRPLAYSILWPSRAQKIFTIRTRLRHMLIHLLEEYGPRLTDDFMRMRNVPQSFHPSHSAANDIFEGDVKTNANLLMREIHSLINGLNSNQ